MQLCLSCYFFFIFLPISSNPIIKLRNDLSNYANIPYGCGNLQFVKPCHTNPEREANFPFWPQDVEWNPRTIH